MKTLDERIAEAKAQLAKSEDGSDAHKALLAKIEALTSLKDDGLGFSQDDLNSAAAAERKAEAARWEGTLGMKRDEVETVINDVEGSLEDSGEGGEGGDQGAVLQRLQADLQTKQEKIDSLETNTQKFERELRTERVLGQLSETMKAGGLNEKYKAAAIDLARPQYETLIEKTMKGEEVKPEEYQAITDSVKTRAEVFFEGEREEWHGIPPVNTEVEQAQSLTDEQRRQAETPVF